MLQGNRYCKVHGRPSLNPSPVFAGGEALYHWFLMRCTIFGSRWHPHEILSQPTEIFHVKIASCLVFHKQFSCHRPHSTHRRIWTASSQTRYSFPKYHNDLAP